jgi:hypothetical protein
MINGSDSTQVFESVLIAPCGMNCGTCFAYLREKNKCCGCWPETGRKVNHCFTCSIKNCESLAHTSSKFCYECEEFPCKRLKQIDKRYRTKYRTSFIENQLSIKENGITKFLEEQTLKWSCPRCGETLSCHRSKCLKCNYEYIV